MGTFLRKLYTKKEKKLSGRFWENNILSEKLTTDDNDGRIGISKAPLPSDNKKSYQIHFEKIAKK